MSESSPPATPAADNPPTQSPRREPEPLPANIVSSQPGGGACYRIELAWGRLRRAYLKRFRPGYVRASLARRVGQCNRTGACCKLMFTCPLLKQQPEPVRCGIQERKPKVCQLFPIDERDLRDRDIVSPASPCGFSFLPGDHGGGRPARDDRSVS